MSGPDPRAGADPRPGGVRDLATAELLVLWSVRQRLARGESCPRLVEGFRRCFGLASMERALAAFETAYAVLDAHLVRDVELLPPACGCMSRDEALLLHLCAAVQARRTAHAIDVACTVVGPVWARVLCDRLARFVAVLAHRGMRLPLRAVVSPVEETPPPHRSTTVH